MREFTIDSIKFKTNKTRSVILTVQSNSRSKGNVNVIADLPTFFKSKRA